jgi:hypothetical protein
LHRLLTGLLLKFLAIGIIEEERLP